MADPVSLKFQEELTITAELMHSIIIKESIGPHKCLRTKKFWLPVM